MVHLLVFAAANGTTKAGKAIALALGIGLGSLGAGVGIGNIFGSMIQAVARQPERRGELQGIQWLGFALTEAVVSYGLLGSLLAYVLVGRPDAARDQPADSGHAGADDLDGPLLPDHALRPQALRLRAHPEADRRAPRADPAGARRGRPRSGGGAAAPRGAPQADRPGEERRRGDPHRGTQ